MLANMSKNKEKKKELSEEEQLYAAEKVQKEIKSAEEFLKANHSEWTEQYLNAYSTSLKRVPSSELEELERKHRRKYVLSDIYHNKRKGKYPLRIETITDSKGNNHLVEFGRVDCLKIDNLKVQKSMTFSNDGTIVCSQITRGLKGTTYDARYNVLSPSFQVVMMIDSIGDKTFGYDYYSFELEGSVLKEVWNDTEIYRDFEKKTTKAYKIKNNDKKAKKKITDVETIEAIEEIIIDKMRGITSDIPVKGLMDRIDQCLETLKKQKGPQKNKKRETPNNEGEK